MYLSGIFTIILVLELAVFESQVVAFTIQRQTEPTNSDLDVAETTHHLEVRNDLKSDVRPNEIKSDSPALQVPIKTTAKTEEIQKNVTTSKNTADIILSPTSNPSSDSLESTTAALGILKSNSSVTFASSTRLSFNIPSDTIQKTENITTTPTMEIVIITNDAEKNNETLKTTTWTSLENQKYTTDNRNIDPVNGTEIVNTTNQVNVTNKVNITMNSTNIVNATNAVNLTNKINDPVNSTNIVNATNAVNITNNVNDHVNSTSIVNSTNAVNITNKVDDPVNSTNIVNSTNAVNITNKVDDPVNSTNIMNTTNPVNVTDKNNADPVNSTNIVNVTNSINATNKANIDPVYSNNIVNATYQSNVTNKVNASTEMNPIRRFNATKLLKISEQAKAATQVNLLDSSAYNMYNILENTTTWENNAEKNEVKSKTEENNATSNSPNTIYKSTNKSLDSGSQEIITSDNSTTKLWLDNQDSNLDMTLSPETNNTSEHEKSTELRGEHSEVTVVPYWKKYTTIERMKTRLNTTKDFTTKTVTASSSESVSTTETLPNTEVASINSLLDLLQSDTAQTHTNKDLLQSGTAQTYISLKEALNTVSEIPSLEQLKNDFLAINNMNSTTEFTTKSKNTEIQGKNTTQPEKSVSLMVNTATSTTEVTTQAYNIVSSKRAGFLDFSTRPVVSAGTNTSQETVYLTEVSWNYTDLSTSKTTPQSPTSKTSQSQLVEDAIKEELMKEEFLMDSVENAERQQDDRFSIEIKPTENVQRIPVISITSETSTEDKLRVKPIISEKPKNESLYVVGPNYKPLKKIEIQPPKPFVRNPDDNSWRNESLSSLGIVFKANNSSKPFTQVLKNKTETEWNTLLEKYNKDEEPELRTRLEKIAEIRKSKKKKVNALGETVYTDYEETVSSENLNSSKSRSFPYISNVGNISSLLDEIGLDKLTTIQAKIFDDMTTTTAKAKFLDEYAEDDDSEDYTLPNIDIKKFNTSTPTTPGRVPVLPIQLTTLMTPMPANKVRINTSDRQPTLQYFPPIDKQQKPVIKDFDTVFQKKLNVINNAPRTFKTAVPAAPTTPVTFQLPKNKFEPQNRPKLNEVGRRPEQMDKNIYLTHPPHDQRTTNGYASQLQDAAGYNQASYVIKHLRDFIDEMVKADENVAPDEPLQGVTVNSVVHKTIPKTLNDYYDYEAQFRKDVINRFAENFNQNSERFKADFPVLYNTSVIHSMPGLSGGEGAESTAFMKRLYEDSRLFQLSKDVPKRYDPNCDRTVELSPAYELHYYVPEEEEKQEMDVKSLTGPPQHRLHS